MQADENVYRKGVTYTRHRLSRVFGDMPEDEFKELVADIGDNGQFDEIFVKGTQVIDGWHRYRACLEAGVEPFMVEYDDEEFGSAEKFVASKNFYRRQMPAEERVRVAAELLGYEPSGKKGRTSGKATAKEVAATAGVNERTVRRTFEKGDDKPAPTLEALQKRRKMLVGQLTKVDAQIAEIQASERVPAPHSSARVRRSR